MLACGLELRGRPFLEARRPAARLQSRRPPRAPGLLRRIPRLPRDSPRPRGWKREIRECPLRHPRRGDTVWPSSSRVRSIVVSQRGGRQFRDGKFDQEARSNRMIVLNVDAAAMFGDDACGDGQAESGSAVLGGEMRQEEFVFVLRRNTGAGVRDTDLDGFRVGIGLSGNENFAARRAWRLPARSGANILEPASPIPRDAQSPIEWGRYVRGIARGVARRVGWA